MTQSFGSRHATVAGADQHVQEIITRFVEGHLSHLLQVDIVAVLRAAPSVIAERLAGRNYSREKIQENVEAEAIGVILSEAVELAEPTGQKIYDIDTTSLSENAVADVLEDILLEKADPQRYVPGNVDWSEEILSWY